MTRYVGTIGGCTCVLAAHGVHACHHCGAAIVGWVFTPHASGAGYFGPAAHVWAGDGDLDVEDVDGPFWRAVQAALSAANPFTVDWQE